MNHYPIDGTSWDPHDAARLNAALVEVQELARTLVRLIDQRGGSMEIARAQLRHVGEYLAPREATAPPPPPADRDNTRNGR